MLADEVYLWLSEQPTWQQDLARRLTSQLDLEPEQYADALAMIKEVFGAPTEVPAVAPVPLQREDMALDTADGAARLLGLGSLQGIGLVNDSEQLTFGPAALTIVYGQNAAGKSTYVKALKKLCRTVDRDCQIRPNIYKDGTPATPSVRVKVGVNGETVERRTVLEGPKAFRLAGMSVFGGACAELYVNEQNTVQYLPTELRLLTRLANLQDRVRRDLAAQRDTLKQSAPPTDDYPPDTAVGTALRALTGQGSDPDLAELAKLTEQNRQRLISLRAAIAAAEASTAGGDAAAAERDATDAASLIADLKALHQKVDAAAAERLRNSAAANDAAQQAVRLASEQLTGPVAGIGSEPWQLLWDAARAFIESEAGTFPPPTGQPCPLCMQPVTADTAERMAHFEAHVTSSVRSIAAAREREFADALFACDPSHATTVANNPLLVRLRDRTPELAAVVSDTAESIGAQLEMMHSTPKTAAASVISIEPAVEALTSWANDRSSRATTLRAADDSAKLASLRAELADLTARERLTHEIDRFTDWQQKLRVISAIEEAHTALATNRITSTQKTMIENDLNKALEAALTTELQQLSCTLPVEVRTNTARAETRVGVRLVATDPPRVSEIASEGERRALALCCFFAELQVANDSGGIVVDDPVSSLDDERHICIARRLVAEAARRQVIVFTHDLPFVFELRAAAKKASMPVHIQHVWRQGDDVGRVDEDPPFKTMNLQQRITKLEQDVAAMRTNRAGDNDEAWRQVEAFYKRVRTTWERAVEERLFAGIVERFERDVKTKSLPNVKLTTALIDVVDAGMTRASLFVHEDAYAAQVSLPSIDEMASDVGKLRELERATRNS